MVETIYILKSNSIKILLIVLLTSCRYNEPFVWTKPNNIQSIENVNSLQLTSNNPFLNKRICLRLIEAGIDMNCETNQSTRIGKKNIKVHIESTVKNRSNDFFRNVGISFLTLSFGAIITHSADFEYTVHFPVNKDNMEKPDLVFYSTGRDGMYAILPFYLGLASTIVGTVLNNYRNVDSLENYCLREPITKKVEILEQDKETFCKDLEMFHSNALNGVDKKIAQSILENLVEE